MISDDKIIEIFCSLDDFMKEFNSILDKNSISDGSQPKNVIESLKCPRVK